MSSSRKLELMESLYHTAYNLKTEAVSKQHPDWTNEQVQKKVRELFLYANS